MQLTSFTDYGLRALIYMASLPDGRMTSISEGDVYKRQDVVRELEPLSLVNCSSEFCHITPACRLKQALSKAVQSFLKELDNYTLADLVEENQPLYKLLLVE